MEHKLMKDNNNNKIIIMIMIKNQTILDKYE